MQRNLGLPYNEDIERLVLGTLMTRRDALAEAGPGLTEDCFYHNFHKRIFRAIKSVDAKGTRPDAMTVWNEMKGAVDPGHDWPAFLKVMDNETFDLPQHVAILDEYRGHRKIYEIGQYLLSNVHTTENSADVIENARKQLDGVHAERESGVTTLYEAVSEVVGRVNSNMNRQDVCTGSPTGFKALDRLGVLRPSNLTVIAADSSQGKTSLAVSFCMNAAAAGTKIAFYTMEMTPAELASRMLSRASGISGRTIMNAPLKDGEISAFDNSVQKVCGLPIYFDGRSNSSIDVILSSIRMLKKRHDIDGAVVDYLQILSVNGRTNNEEMNMGSVARRLKNIAKDLNIWVLALSQLSRDKTDVAPNLYRIRGSGQITEAADNVMLLYRPEVYGRDKRYPEPHSGVSTVNTAMIDLAKGRNIGTMKMICGFDAPTTRFYDLPEIPRITSTEATEDNPF